MRTRVRRSLRVAVLPHTGADLRLLLVTGLLTLVTGPVLVATARHRPTG